MNSNHTEFTPQQIPDLGWSLLLQFSDVNNTVLLSNYEQLNQEITNIIKSQLQTEILSQNHFSFNNLNDLFIQYTLPGSYLNIKTSTYNNFVNVDLYLNVEDAENKVLKAETKFYDLFGWLNCTQSLCIPKGLNTQFLMNNNFFTSSIFKDLTLVSREKSKYQDIRVYDSTGMGRLMALDNQIQVTDQLVDNYTIDLTRNVINPDKDQAQILMIGAGDMYIPTYLIQKFSNIKVIYVCEIDRKVTETVLKHFKVRSQIQKALDANKIKVFNSDGAEFIKNLVSQGQKFDGIIIDNTDADQGTGEVGVAASLFTIEFYRDIYNLLNPGCSFSQQVSDEIVKTRFEKKVRNAGFQEMTFIYSKTPEYSIDLPIGIAKKI